MIAAWQVVAVLVPLCAVSAFVGYAYARRLAEIESLDEDELIVVPPPPPPPLPPMVARPGDERIDLSERLGPFGPARSKPSS